MEQLDFHWTDFYEIWVFFENLARKLKFHEDLTRITGTLREVLCIFMIISPWILRRMRNASNKSCKGTENPCFMLSTSPPTRKSCRLWGMWKYMVQSNRPHRTILNVACAVHAWKPRLQTHAQNTLFHGNSGYANAPQSYVYTYTASHVFTQQYTHSL